MRRDGVGACVLVEQCVCEGEGGGGACASRTVCLWGEGVVGVY